MSESPTATTPTATLAPGPLDKAFEPAHHEGALYQRWMAEGAFKADPAQPGQAYSIVFPPPNVTGTLHLGHALTFTLQDILCRWQRLKGANVLFQPGTDHAGIATQMVVERMLDREGTSRTALGRPGFLERVWAWKEEHGGRIVEQLKRLGTSADWSRERFTMDDGLSRAVRRVFVQLYKEGLIYRDRRLVNWDPAFRSAISDLEVDNKETKGSLWHVRYPVERDGKLTGEYVTIATTRPETMLADAAVAVHPSDERFAHLKGAHVRLPLTGRRVPLIEDEHSDPEKGTGAVKITPAHDFNDFEVGQRHNLPAPTMLDEGANIWLDEIMGEVEAIAGVSDPAFVSALAGMGRDDARKAMVAELDRLGFLAAVEDHTLQQPVAERGGAVVEPRLTMQWYCDAPKLAGPAIKAVEGGAIAFEPKQWENTFFAWMRDIRPWCISRQLWWGHRLPVWYGSDGRTYVAETEEEALAEARAHSGPDVALRQDEDVLDTWFSSGLWPFSTLGWPDRNDPFLERYYPTSTLVTGFDIIFFWVSRMMMLGLHFMEEVPFRKVVIHGLVRDENGQKMSKSKGNGIDPLDLIAEYGADATRLTICAGTGPGRDIKLGRGLVEERRAFITKLWNAARFAEMNQAIPREGAAPFNPNAAQGTLARWIVAEAQKAAHGANNALEASRFDDYARLTSQFVRDVFCDWFLEFAKGVFNSDDAANQAEKAELRAATAWALGAILRMLHPVMPFVTATLWDKMGYGALQGDITKQRWPEMAQPGQGDQSHESEIAWLMDVISAVRSVRAEMNVPPSRKAPLLLRGADAPTMARAQKWQEVLGRMGRIEGVESVAEVPGEVCAQVVFEQGTGFIPLGSLIDINAEKERLARDIQKVEGEITKVSKMLGNEKFLARAKPEVVAENRARLAQFEATRSRLQAGLARLG
ncbi:valine--tRNA ligase [Formicincola oecophyllae]|uniref:Valine--tRNA ligase n=1 Tax=Formicincola oecophyllae TaxID=2558361 RepID=A0A4Y6U9R3_9PROT|nr:valine--tRNA ligase [Formicincola oecophyllae]QDH14209.1 valine--tRNA ligase [Formicincola oecophyllae]